MKKVLSFILALCIIMTLVPTTFAVASGHSIVYSFGNDYTTQQGTHSSGDALSTYTYEKTNDHFAYYSTNVQSALADNKFQGYYLQLLAENRSIIDGSANGVGSWYAFELNVPAGTYSTEIVYGMRNSGAVEEIYFLDSTEMSDVENNFTTQNLLAEININGSNTNWNTQAVNNELVVPTSGKYYLIIRAKDVTNGRYMSIRQLRATTRTNTTEVPYVVKSSVSEIAVGKTANISTTVKTSYFDSSSAYVAKSYTNATDDITFAYSSNNTSFATVSDMGVVTGVNPGKAEITVSATLNGVTVTDTIPVEVTMANPSGVNIKNYFPDWKWEVDEYYYNYDLKKIDYSATDGFWRYHSKAEGWEPELPGFRTNKGAVTVHHTDAGQWYALAFKVPVKGEYKGILSYGEIKENVATDRFATLADVYLLDEEEIKNVSNNLIPENVIVENLNFTGEKDNAEKTKDIGVVEFEKAGEYYLIVNSKKLGYSMIYDLSLNGGTGTAYMGATAKADKTALTVGETATITATGYMSDRTTVGTVSNWESSDTSVATVENRTVKAVSAGTATITANVTYNEAVTPVSISLTVSDVKVENGVTIAVDYEGEGKNITVDSTTYKLGDTVTITANTPSGKVFRGWVRGSAENGRLVSTDEAYTFKALTNIYLTAVYTDAASEEYYAWNGAFLGITKPAEGTEPVVLGYSFKEWAEHVMSENLTRFVAHYEQASATYDVTYNGDVTPYKYDDEVVLNSDEEVYWYRDGKLVDYGKEYKFNVWDKTVVTTSGTGNNGAKIMLDKVVKNTATQEKSYMIEYDKGDKTILEVGILFGENAVPTVENCNEKMSSQRNEAHGQFSAASEYTYARGYLIYNDNGTYRVIYAD